MGRKSNSEQRRQQVVHGLMNVMVNQGFSGASVADMARAVGLAPGLVHHHFKDKQEVLLDLVKHLGALVWNRYLSLVESTDQSPRQRLHALLDAHLALGPGANPHAVAAWSIIGAEALHQKEVRLLYRQAMARLQRELKELLVAALPPHRSRQRESEHLAALMVTVIEGAYRVAAAAPGVLPRGYAAPMARRALDALLDQHAAPQRKTVRRRAAH